MSDDVNPFRFGALALDDAFTDRKEELAELEADIRNGQDVVVFAPRRYGKSSLVWRAPQELVREKVLVAQRRPDDDADAGQAGGEARARDPRRRRVRRCCARRSA